MDEKSSDEKRSDFCKGGVKVERRLEPNSATKSKCNTNGSLTNLSRNKCLKEKALVSLCKMPVWWLANQGLVLLI